MDTIKKTIFKAFKGTLLLIKFCQPNMLNMQTEQILQDTQTEQIKCVI